MKRSGGITLCCLALLTIAACSNADPPPAEGASVGNLGWQQGIYTIAIHGAQAPDLNSHITGDTVLDGRNGYHVSCTVKGLDLPFQGSISSPEGPSLDVAGASATQGATFTAAMFGGGTASSSPGGTVNILSDKACKITQLSTELTKPGTIWAVFECANLTSQNSLGDSGHISLAEFLFTGCGT